MNEKLIIIIGILVIIAALIVILKVSSKIRNKVYKLFLLAEKDAESGQKMDYVVEHIYQMLPTSIGLLLNETILRYVLQKMFDVVKDFLNDGKINNK